ncbi:MAG: hypothetical protein KDA61_00725 [Planctomycetales bacterium]|nr:hypothetical protein [Planctomycetales bacterium]
MSMGPLPPIISSAAGAPFSQTAGADNERAKKDAAAQSRQSAGEIKAEAAAGVGEMAEDQQTSDRDADGRRLWEAPVDPQHAASGDDPATVAERRPKDPSGQSGGQLDLTG